MRNDPVLQPEDRRLVNDEVKFAEMIVYLAAGLVFARYPVEQIVDPREVIVEILDVRDLGNVALCACPIALLNSSSHLFALINSISSSTTLFNLTMVSSSSFVNDLNILIS